MTADEDLWRLYSRCRPERDELQAFSDSMERLNIGRYVLRSKETDLGVPKPPYGYRRPSLSRKDIPAFLERLSRLSGENSNYPPAANRDRKEIDPRD